MTFQLGWVYLEIEIVSDGILFIRVLIDVTQNIPDWKEYLMKKLVGAETLPVDFYLQVNLELNKMVEPFRLLLSVCVSSFGLFLYLENQRLRLLSAAVRKHEASVQTRHARGGRGPQTRGPDPRGHRGVRHRRPPAAALRGQNRQRRLRFLVPHAESPDTPDRLVQQRGSSHQNSR